MTEVIMTIQSVMIPILVIIAFIIGYNINATNKIKLHTKKKKTEKSEDELMLERIENAHY